MQTPNTFLREAGTGPGVVCIHSNASSSSQWRGLLDRLAPNFHVLAPDSYGAGKGPAWTESRALMLADEVALIEPVLAMAGSPLSLLGHSYGGAVALKAALLQPDRVRAMAVYEPTLFALLEEENPRQPPANGIRDAAEDAAVLVDRGDPYGGAKRFIDYWMGDGAFASMPEVRQIPIAASVASVRAWSYTLFNEPTPLAAFHALKCPVLYMTGAKSPPSGRGVARLLSGVLPNVEVLEFPKLGHMGPVTHPDVVNDAIADFLSRI